MNDRSRRGWPGSSRTRSAPAGAEPVEPSDPSQDAIDAELDGVVRRHVRELPAAWQEPVLLRVRQGLTVPEIAATLGRPAGTIRGQLARGLARLAHRTEWKTGGRWSTFVVGVGDASFARARGLGVGVCREPDRHPVRTAPRARRRPRSASS